MANMVQIRRGGRQRHEGPEAKIGRSQFDRSHGLKMTFDASYLYPIFLDEILPGDTMTCKMNGFARIFSPLKAPVMDNIELEVFWFFCPTRLLWENWENFQGSHVSAGAQDTSYTIPVIASGMTVDHDNNKNIGGVAANLGLPDGLASATVTGVSALPFRMYTRVYNEWFRDQNLTDEKSMKVDNGPDAASVYFLWKSNKKHDYFTSCLPYLQKGSAQTVALQGMVDVQTDSAVASEINVYSTAAAADHELSADTTNVQVDATAGTDLEELYVDLTTTRRSAAWTPPSIDINALRQSVAIQRLLERDARGGTRYVESIKAHFGVTSPDFRLQRPEYLGGGKSMINVSAVAATTGIKAASSPDALDSNVGELRGVGTGVITGSGFAKSFTEHGYLMGILRARADLTYFQGMDRLWSKSTRYDFYIPALANLGEQSVLNQEIWVSNSSATDIAVFGYQERWSEYRQKHSRVVGNFNPDVSGSLAFWHLAEDFSSLPALNTAFMADSTPMDRITTVTTEPDFLLDVWFDYKCARPLPVFSVPSLTGRF